MAAALSSFMKGPEMDWTSNDGLYTRYKLWKQRCELLFKGPLIKIEEKVLCSYLLFWSGERGLELFNSWNLQQKDTEVLESYWNGFEAAVKPHSNQLMSAWELHNLKQGEKSIEEFISKKWEKMGKMGKNLPLLVRLTREQKLTSYQSLFMITYSGPSQN